MRIFCEVVVQDVLPAVRALLAKELMSKYDMTQQEAAKKLGLSQAAVSQYLRSLRGNKVKSIQKDPEIMSHVQRLASKLASGEIPSEKAYDEFCEICKNAVRSKIVNPSSTDHPGTENCTLV